MAEQDTNTAQAADQNQDQSGQPAQGGEAGNQGIQDGGNGADPDKEFNQKVWSAAGRLYEKKMKEERGKMREDILAELKPMFQSAQAMTGTEDETLKKFNEKVSEKLFSGDAVGAMDMVLSVKEQAKRNLTNAQNINLMRGMTTYSDKPYYEDIQPEMQKLAKEKIAQNWPPDAALKASYAEAKANFLESRMSGGEREHGNLNLTSGGRQTQRGKVVKLPPEFEKACARDIADGIFKNRDEWVKSLSPKVRERVGL